MEQCAGRELEAGDGFRRYGDGAGFSIWAAVDGNRLGATVGWRCCRLRLERRLDGFCWFGRLKSEGRSSCGMVRLDGSCMMRRWLGRAFPDVGLAGCSIGRGLVFRCQRCATERWNVVD